MGLCGSGLGFAMCRLIKGVLYVCSRRLCVTWQFRKRNFNNADASTNSLGQLQTEYSLPHQKKAKNWQTIFFLLCAHRQMCLESLAMKNGCLVAGFGICQRHSVHHTMPTQGCRDLRVGNFHNFAFETRWGQWDRLLPAGIGGLEKSSIHVKYS